MTSSIKPINTRYAGHLFRSRLEARWAVFMDALQWQWSYEPEGFDLPYSGFYLPDFLVTATPGFEYKTPFWVEIKPTSPSRDEVNKLRELACLSGHQGYFFIDTPTHHVICEGPSAEQRERRGEQTFKTLLTCTTSWMGMCDMFDSRQVPHSTFSPMVKGPKPQLSLEDKRRNEFYRELDRLLVEGSTHPCRPIEELVSLERAAKAALSARFEHGHSGAT